jgi:hypothetical protein
MSMIRDLPPLSSSIIWARQIDRQLQLLMKRVEDVLGKGWELYAEGQRLQAESTAFRKKLDTRGVWEAWVGEVGRRGLGGNSGGGGGGSGSGGGGSGTGAEGKVFEVLKTRAPAPPAVVGGISSGTITTFSLTITFDPSTITLFKEIRNLLWLGFNVPHSISNLAKDAKRVYPHAVSLMESVRTWDMVVALIGEYSCKDAEGETDEEDEDQRGGVNGVHSRLGGGKGKPLSLKVYQGEKYMGMGVDWLLAEWREEVMRMIGKGAYPSHFSLLTLAHVKAELCAL